MIRASKNHSKIELKTRSKKRSLPNQIFTGFGVHLGRLLGSKLGKIRMKISIEFLVPNFPLQYVPPTGLGGARDPTQLKLVKLLVGGKPRVV